MLFHLESRIEDNQSPRCHLQIILHIIRERVDKKSFLETKIFTNVFKFVKVGYVSNWLPLY